LTADASAPLRIDIAVADERARAILQGALASHPEIRLTKPGEPADVSIILARSPGAGADGLLTVRENEVLRLLAEGASNREIGARLGISTHTAKFHVRRLLDKLDATGRTDAVAQAARIGMIHL
jgi:DNA-binding CsgD family transcriptional regulator